MSITHRELALLEDCVLQMHQSHGLQPVKEELGLNAC